MKHSPSKAMILCAGLGTRMLPLSKSIPKPMMPVWGRPLLDRTIDLLASWGVEEILINLHHLPDEIFKHLVKRQSKSPRIVFSYEAQILGTGGSLKQASWFFGKEPFWLVNGDILAKLRPTAILKAYNHKNTIASAWLTDEHGPRTVRINDGIIRDFHDKAPGSPGTYTFCGLQLVSPDILQHLDKDAFSSVISAYKRAMRAGKTIAGVPVKNSFWADMGTPEAYLQAHERVWTDYCTSKKGVKIHFDTLTSKNTLSKRGVKTSGFVCMDKSSQARRGASISDSIIMRDVLIEKDASLSNALIATDLKIFGKASGTTVPYSMAREPGLDRCLKALGWKNDKVAYQAFEARGSQRSYYRVINKRRSVIIVLYDPSRKENLLTVKHTNFLKQAGVGVPRVIGDFPSHCASIFEDAGDLSLLKLMQSDLQPAKIIALYKQVLRNIFIMHTEGTTLASSRRLPVSAPFTPKLYRWERQLFDDFLLKIRLGIGKRQRDLITSDISMVSAALYRSKKVLVHRDLQSTNVIFKNNKALLIDYQGMRLGPAVYDLASLLCDPYVMLSQSIQMGLFEYYASLTGNKANLSERFFWLGAVQRLTQALGAFARLASYGPTSRFGAHIPNGILMLNRALDHLSGLTNLKRFTDRFLDKNG